MRKIIILALMSILSLCSCGFTEEIIKLATTTSTYETGILDYILKPFEKKHSVKVHIISVGTGKAIKLGQNGDVDIVLVHAPETEEEFVKAGYGVNRRDVMYNDFVILGPRDDPAQIIGLKSAKEALGRIYKTKYTFVSRGDTSGTDKKEKYLWAKAQITPSGTWYLETGQGMSTTLRIAEEIGGYLLIDRGTYLFRKNNTRLKKLLEGDEDLFNPYGVIAISPDKHPHVKYELSLSLIAWLTSEECQDMINNYKLKGHQPFHANVKDESK